MGNILAELKRRHIYRVAGAYAVVAWFLLQVVNNVAPIIEAPPWVAQFCLLLLALGLPLAVFFAWMRELPPSLDAFSSKATLTDWVLIGILAAVLGSTAYGELLRPGAPGSTGVRAAREAAASPFGISLAVMPFANLSSDPEQEFFSDGMTEEITSALAKVPDLRVVARSSAFEFKGKNVNVKTLGDQLGATHLIEGSVRKAGGRLRIAVQLIKSGDGTHIWAEDYDRELTDVFQIQEDIARAVTASLRMPLGLKPGENLVSNRKIDPDSYQQYLRAKALNNARTLSNLNTAVALLEQVLARNPDYAPGWSLLADLEANLPNYVAFSPAARVEEMRPVVEASRNKAEPAARNAIRLDPELADGYVALAGILSIEGNFLAAEDMFTKGLALDPSNAHTLDDYAGFLLRMGMPQKALPLKRQSFALEPVARSDNSRRNLAINLWLMGDDDAALDIFKGEFTILDMSRFIAMVHAGAGRFEDAVEALMSASPGLYRPAILNEAMRLLQKAPSSVAPANPMPLGALDFVNLYTGAPERVLNYYERNAEAGRMVNAQTPLLWHSSYSPARKTERFKALMRKTGHIAYWRAKGWPEFCHPTTGDDFACD